MNPPAADDNQELTTRLKPLLLHLRLVQGSNLWVVVVPTLSFQRRVADFIGQQVQNSYSIAELRYADGQIGFTEKIRSLPIPERGHAVVFICDLDKLEEAQRNAAIRLLNRGREVLAGSSYTVVLFVLTPTLKEIIHHAGDLWTWRSGVSDLSDLAATGVGENEILRQRYLEALIRQHHDLRLPLFATRSEAVDLERVYVPFDRLLPYTL